MYHNYATNKNTIYIGLFLIILSIFFIAHYLFVDSDSVLWAAITYNHFTPLYLLLGPLLYFYLRGVILDEFIFKKADLLHFIPALIFLISITEYIFIPWGQKLEIIRMLKSDFSLYEALQQKFNSFFSMKFNVFVRSIILIIYLIVNIFSLVKFSLNSHTHLNHSIRGSNMIRWLYVFHFLVLIIVVSYISYLFKIIGKPLYAYNPESITYLLPSIISMVMINVLLLSNPSILYGITRIRSIVVNNEVNTGKIEAHKSNVNIDAVEIEYFKELAQKIEKYFIEKKPYTKVDFDLTDLTIAMEVPLHHITICFRQYINVKFTDYKNKFRVEEAKQLLNSSSMDNFTIEAIGEQVGFQSKSNFFTSFKKITGLTPLEYKKGL